MAQSCHFFFFFTVFVSLFIVILKQNSKLTPASRGREVCHNIFDRESYKSRKIQVYKWMVQPKRLGYNAKLFPQILLCGMYTNFNCSNTTTTTTPILNWSLVRMETGHLLPCQLQMLAVIKSVQCAKHGTQQTAPSSHLSLYCSPKSQAWRGEGTLCVCVCVESVVFVFIKYLGGSMVILAMKLAGFMGGAEQTDPPPLLGAQDLNTSIHFGDAIVFPAIINALLLLLLGGFSIPPRCLRKGGL